MARAEEERQAIASDLSRLEPLARLGDHAIHVGRAVAAHPGWVLAGVATVAALRPRLLVRGMRRAWTAWRIMRGIRRLL